MMLEKWMWAFYPFERILFKYVLKTFNYFWFLIPFIISTYMWGVEGVTPSINCLKNLPTIFHETTYDLSMIDKQDFIDHVTKLHVS